MPANWASAVCFALRPILDKPLHVTYFSLVTETARPSDLLGMNAYFLARIWNLIRCGWRISQPHQITQRETWGAPKAHFRIHRRQTRVAL